MVSVGPGSRNALEAVTYVERLLVAAEAQNLVIGISSSPNQSRNIAAISSESLIQKMAVPLYGMCTFGRSSPGRPFLPDMVSLSWQLHTSNPTQIMHQLLLDLKIYVMSQP